MTVRLRTLAESPALERVMCRYHRDAWPRFLRDDTANVLWPRLFQPIRVDRRRDRVHYEEANVWMLHRVPARPRRAAARRASRPEEV